jgi:hypothetical protein
MKFNFCDAVIALMIAVGSLSVIGLVISICYSNTSAVIACSFGISSAAFVGAGVAGRKNDG